MKTRAKGRKNRSQGLQWLKEHFKGDLLYSYTVPEGRYSKDAFGVADALIIIKGMNILPVQFKSNEWGETGKYKKWVKETGVPLIVVRKDDRKGFRIRVIEA
jgi:hypothetical protein